MRAGFNNKHLLTLTMPNQTPMTGRDAAGIDMQGAEARQGGGGV